MNHDLSAASPEDQAWLDQLRREVYQELFVATWGAWDEDRHQRHFADCLKRGNIFMIQVQGQNLGMIQLFEQADALEVAEIQIAPEAQSQGLGRAVLKDVLGRAHADKKCVRLSLGLKNEKAYQLYTRLGFKLVKQTETHKHMVCAAELMSDRPESKTERNGL